MSQNFTKALDPYEDDQHKPVKGKYHFAVPLDIEPACYTMNIDYESHDKVNSDAYQYDGYIVVGHRAYLKTSPIIIPYQTSATSEDAVTLYEKRNTSFNLVVEAFKNTELTNAIKTLPLYFRVLKGQFKDYYANASTARKTVDTDFNNAYIPTTITLPKSTDTNGKVTTNVKVSDIYSTSETINDINTVIFKCIGTRDRKTDNYVPVNIEAPLIIGTTHVFLRNVPSNTRTVTIDNEEKTVASTCGRGKIEFACDLLYEFTRNPENTNNYTMKYGYEEWRTDRSKFVKVGKVYLEYYDDATEKWIIIPKDQLEVVDNTTLIESDGAIIQKPGHENGGMRVAWTNTLPYSTRKNIKYRWKYTGKPGATYGLWSPGYWLALAPEYDDPEVLNTEIIFTNPANGILDIVSGETSTIEGKVVISGSNEVVPNAGTVSFVLNGTTYTANVGSNGTFSLNIPSLPVGTTTLPIKFTPSSDDYLESTMNAKAVVTKNNVSLTLPSTAITLNNPNYDTGAIESGTTFTVKVKGENNTVVPSGTVRLKLQAKTSSEDISQKYTIWSSAVTSSKNTWSVDKDSLDIKAILHAMNGASRLMFTNYTLSAEYTASDTTNYNNATEEAPLNTVAVKCTAPQVKIECVGTDDDRFTDKTTSYTINEVATNGNYDFTLRLEDVITFDITVKDKYGTNVSGLTFNKASYHKTKAYNSSTPANTAINPNSYTLSSSTGHLLLTLNRGSSNADFWYNQTQLYFNINCGAYPNIFASGLKYNIYIKDDTSSANKFNVADVSIARGQGVATTQLILDNTKVSFDDMTTPNPATSSTWLVSGYTANIAGKYELFIEPALNATIDSTHSQWIDPIKLSTIQISNSSNKSGSNNFFPFNFGGNVLNTMASKNRFKFTDYNVYAVFTPNNTLYDPVTLRKNNFVDYLCVNPKVQFTSRSKSIGATGTGNVTHEVGRATKGGQIDIIANSNVVQDKDVTFTFQILDSNDLPVGGVGLFIWFLCPTKTITIHKMNDDGTFVRDENNQLIEDDSTYKDMNGNVTDVPVSPAKPNDPVPMGYFQPEIKNLKTNYGGANSFEWYCTSEELSDGTPFYMYIVCDRFVDKMFNNADVELRQPIESAIANAHNQPDVMREYSLVLKVKYQMTV